MTLRLGTRGSQLALAQSGQVAAALTARTGVPVELVVIRTRGDVVQDRPLREVGGKGLFTKELEEALLAGEVDFAVHSLKDMPIDQPPGLVLGAVPEREDPRDALVGAALADLPHGATVGTGSLRRTRQLLAIRPDLNLVGLRGNVDTRVRRQREGDFSAVVLACAGLRRLGRNSDIAESLEPEVMVPAVGQGALALQVREGDARVLAWLSALHHPDTAVCVEAERAFLRGVDGGCSVPVAGFAVLEGEQLWLRGVHAPEEGAPLRRAEARGHRTEAASLGELVAAAVR
jgi:hydroxymethylbilane synthase